MKKILVFCLCLLIFPNFAFAVSDEDALASFKSYIKVELEKVKQSYEGNRYSMYFMEADKKISRSALWYKQSAAINPEYKIDLQKTNSLISPYLGTLEVKIDDTIFIAHPIKEIAASLDLINYRTYSIYIFSIAYQDDKWVITAIRDYDSVLKKWTEHKGVEQSIYPYLKCYNELHTES